MIENSIVREPRPVTVLEPELQAIYTDVAGQLAPRSRKMYQSDTRHFAAWLVANGSRIETVTRSQMIAYRQHLADTRAKVTAARMLTVARRLCEEAVKRGLRPDNPAADVRGFKGVSRSTTPHTALELSQVSILLRSIDRSDRKGLRDYALLSLLLRTGIRRSEAAALTMGDLATERGHHIARLRHAKGDVAHTVKIPVDLWRDLTAYIEATGRRDAGQSAPLFVRFYKGDTPSNNALTGEAIERIVKRWAKAAEIDDLSPHGLRASFITLALEGGAALQQVQYAAGHADPRTTERYQKRKLNLDDNAVDYVRPKSS